MKNLKKATSTVPTATLLIYTAIPATVVVAGLAVSSLVIMQLSLIAKGALPFQIALVCLLAGTITAAIRDFKDSVKKIMLLKKLF